MGFHHIAIATKDMSATHQFYSQAMGFELVHAEKAQTGPEAWAKHFFYDTGDGEMMAFWEIHDDTLDQDHPTSISTGLGLPIWSNHLAFSVDSIAELDAARSRLTQHGYDVTEIDHHWCTSIYVNDPNGIMVEFCVTTNSFDDSHKARAIEALTAKEMPDEAPPVVKIHSAQAE